MKLYVKPVGVLATNCYIVTSGQNHAAVIDPGAQGNRLIEFLDEKGITPQVILLTHGHHDHIGAVNELAQRYGCRAMIGEQDLPMLTDVNLSLAGLRYADADSFRISGAQPLREGDTIQVDELSFRVIETPGHTRGGVCYLCGELLLSGDTLFKDDCGRCDLPGGDYPTMLRSLKKLAALPGDYHVLPGHGPDSSLNYERKNNPYIGIDTDENPV